MPFDKKVSFENGRVSQAFPIAGVKPSRCPLLMMLRGDTFDIITGQG